MSSVHPPLSPSERSGDSVHQLSLARTFVDGLHKWSVLVDADTEQILTLKFIKIAEGVCLNAIITHNNTISTKIL